MRRSFITVALAVVLVGFATVTLTPAADTKKPPDTKKPAKEPGLAKQGRLVKPVVFKVKGSESRLSQDKVQEVLEKSKKSRKSNQPVKITSRDWIKVPVTRPARMSNEDKRYIINQANPILKNMGLPVIQQIELSLGMVPVTLSPKVPWTQTSALAFVHADVVAPDDDYAKCSPPPINSPDYWAPHVDVFHKCAVGNYLVVFHIQCSGTGVFRLVTGVGQGAPTFEDRILEDGMHDVPVIVNVSAAGNVMLVILCDDAAWTFFSCDIQPVK